MRFKSREVSNMLPQHSSLMSAICVCTIPTLTHIYPVPSIFSRHTCTYQIFRAQFGAIFYPVTQLDWQGSDVCPMYASTWEDVVGEKKDPLSVKRRNYWIVRLPWDQTLPLLSAVFPRSYAVTIDIAQDVRTFRIDKI